MDTGEVRSFWDVDQYRRVIKRIENGCKSCDNFLCMVQERAQTELRYAKSLRKWTEKWSGIVENNGAEYGSTVEAWRTCLQEGSVVAQIHEDCRLKIIGEEGPFYNLYKWKKEHYHRGASGCLQEASEANDGFANAQKRYSRLLTKCERAKKAYHEACVSAHKACVFTDQEATNQSVRPEFQRKLQQRATKFTAQRDRIKQVYLKRVMKCNGQAKDRYVREMTGEFSRWQTLERARLDTVHAQLILLARALDSVSTSNLGELYLKLEERICRADSLRDVQEWDKRFATGCEQHWPRFEELDVDDLDEATYTEVERKSSFGKALMNRRRSIHRSSNSGTYSSKTNYDSEEELTNDDFDSTFDDSDDVFDDQEEVIPEVVHASEHNYDKQGMQHHRNQITSEHRVSGHSLRHQPFGHHVAELSKHYGGQRNDYVGHSTGKLGGQSLAYQESTHFNELHDYDGQNGQYDDFVKHDNDRTSTDQFDHQLSRQNLRSGRRRSLRVHNSKHDHGLRQDSRNMMAQTAANNIPDISLKSKAYHVPQWHHNHGWRPIQYGHSGGTRPTKEVEFNSQDTPQRNKSEYKSSKAAVHLMSPSNYRSITTPVYSNHKTNDPWYHDNWISPYSNQVSGNRPRKNSLHNRGAATVNYHTSVEPPDATHMMMSQSPSKMQTPSVGNTRIGQPLSDHTTLLIEGQSNIYPQKSERHTPIDQARQLLHPKEGEILVKAVYDFKPKSQDELLLKSGELVVQTDKHTDNGWVFGRNLEKTGKYPACYVQPVSSMDLAKPVLHLQDGEFKHGSRNERPLNSASLVTSHSAQMTMSQSPSQMQTPGVAYTKIGQPVADHSTSLFEGQSNMYPTSERHTTMEQARQILHPKDGEIMVKAIYDYKPRTEDELILKSGEVLVQTDKQADNGWVFGRNLERTGKYPGSYVQIVR